MALTDVLYGCVIESHQNLIHAQNMHTNQSNPSKTSSRTTLLHEKHTKMSVTSIDRSFHKIQSQRILETALMNRNSRTPVDTNSRSWCHHQQSTT